MATVPIAMTIAGSDSSGGAGIQADLKTFAALGVYGTSVLTAVTAQNTVGVDDVFELPASLVLSQLEAVMGDIGTDAVKTGMLFSPSIIETVAEALRRYGCERLVVDPVMVAKSGTRLLREDAVDTLRRLLMPLATVVTPNAQEAQVLSGRTVSSHDDARLAAKAIVAIGARAVVVKGGHLEGPAVDVLYDGREFVELTETRIETTSTHGTGCTFASAIAAYLARGLSLEQAVRGAKAYVTEALRRAPAVGHGHGPLGHFPVEAPGP